MSEETVLQSAIKERDERRVESVELKKQIHTLGEENREMCDYIYRRCEQVQETGVEILSKGPVAPNLDPYFLVGFTSSKKFFSRVEALRYAEKLAKAVEGI